MPPCSPGLRINFLHPGPGIRFGPNQVLVVNPEAVLHVVEVGQIELGHVPADCWIYSVNFFVGIGIGNRNDLFTNHTHKNNGTI